MSFKHHINNRFSGCRLLAVTWDVYRHREVRVYQLPGEFEHVGVHDGTDGWVAPTGIDPFKANVREILGQIRAGQNPPVVNHTPTGRIVTETPPPFHELPKARRRLVEEAPTCRRRILTSDYSAVEERAAAPQPSNRRRLQT